MLQLEKRETIADVINLVLGAWLRRSSFRSQPGGSGMFRHAA